MKRWIKWIVVAVILGLVAAGALRALSARKAQKDALAAQQAGQQTQATVELLASDRIAVRMIELPQSLPISGSLKAVNSAIVKARVPGELQGLVVREGDVVKAGDVIARIDATEYQARVKQAQQQAESAKAQVDIAKRSFDNNRSLVDQGFISKTALDSSMSTLAAAEANYRAAQAGADVAAKSLDDTVLRAPIAGLVAQRLAQPGERVAVDARVVEIVDLSRLELEASFNAADSLQVQTGQTAQLTVEGATKPLTAKVVRINPSAVAGSRAVLAYLAVEPSPGLRQGLFAQGSLQTGLTRTLAVPLATVRTDKPAPYVQVVDKGQVLHQSVTLGARGERDGQAMVAVQGVAEGATVLVGSVGTLRAGTPVKLAQGPQ
ncbi:MAG: efflux RND transporter periplasmic adaptor subunit [Burkholderiales bacterium]|nr:efflux RND transporter periplasmic adaptor subunit [Burkholderiales bacterium]